MVIVQFEDLDYFEVKNEENKIIGRGYVQPREDEYLDRVNIYLQIDLLVEENKEEIQEALFEAMLERAHSIRNQNKDRVVKVLHRCYPDKYENIEFYLLKDGFRRDEGLYVLGNNLQIQKYKWREVEGIQFAVMDLEEEEDVLKLEKIDPDIFHNNFSRWNINELKQVKGFEIIAAIHEEEIIGISIVFHKTKRDGHRNIWLLDDLFVREEWRNKGIGKNLVIKALEVVKANHGKSLKVEIWSTQEKPINLYRNLGFDFEGEIQLAIGKYI